MDGIFAASLVPLGAGIFVMVGIPYIFHHFGILERDASALVRRPAADSQKKDLLVSETNNEQNKAIIFSKTESVRLALSKVKKGMEDVKEEFHEMDRRAAKGESGSFWKACKLIAALDRSLGQMEIELGSEDEDDEGESCVEASHRDGEEDEGLEKMGKGGDTESTRNKGAHVEKTRESERRNIPEELPRSWRMWLDAVGQGIRHRDIDDISSDTSEGPPYTSEV
jgi:hypothetical protein